MIFYITGIGWVTAAGVGRGRNFSNFSMPKGRLPKLTSTDVFNKPYKHFGRMDKYSRLGLSAIAFAIKDAGLEKWEKKRHIGIIASTVYGCLHTDIDFFNTTIPNGGLMASPNLFAYTLPNCFLGEAAIYFGLTGESFVVNDSSVSRLASLQIALDILACGEVEKMVCGVCDLGRPPIFGQGKDIPPGALFFVIEKSPESNLSYYGKLSLEKDDFISFNK
ncbi:MAG: beta-ketoacyl synthase, partial [Deltaproteobacteria bacterium]|nr:beta-ketoacyl synthase [Deltaproteobacteria bacterium]